MKQPTESEKYLNGNRMAMTVILDPELQAQLEEIQILIGKKHGKLELLKIMAKTTLEHFERKNRTAQAPVKPARQTAPPPVGKTRKRIAISRPVVREVRMRDQHRCQWKDPETGEQCEARYYLEADHRIPYARGGGNHAGNLQLMCRAHNVLRAANAFGQRQMSQYVPSLR